MNLDLILEIRRESNMVKVSVRENRPVGLITNITQVIPPDSHVARMDEVVNFCIGKIISNEPTG